MTYASAPIAPNEQGRRGSVWYLIALGAIIAVSLLGNLYWIRQNAVFVGHDSTSYMVAALDYRDFLYPLTPQGIFRAFVEPEYRPPGLYIAVQPFFALFGANMDGGQLLLIAMQVVVILLTAALARQVTGPGQALFAAALAAFLPMMAAMARLFYTEMLLTATVLLNLLALYKCNGFARRGWSVVWGGSLGLGLLVKWSMPIYLWLPVIAVLWTARHLLWPASWRPNWRAAGLAAIPAALFVALWFLPNRTQTEAYALGDWLALGWFALAWAFCYALFVKRSPAANLAAAVFGALLIASLWYLPHSNIISLLRETDEERATQAAGLLNWQNWQRYAGFLVDHHLGWLLTWIIVPATLIPWLWVAIRKHRLLTRRAALILLSIASGVIALMLIEQTSPRNLVPMLPQLAIVVALACAWYPRWLRYTLGTVILAGLLLQWAMMTSDSLYPLREATASLWVLPENDAPPASGPTDPGYWIAPEIIDAVTRDSDERQTLAELVTTDWLHRGQLRYLSQTAGKRVRYIGLTEPGANWQQLIQSSWVLTKSGDPGSVDTPETWALLNRIEGSDTLFHVLFKPARTWTLPDGDVVTLWRREGYLDWDRLAPMVDPWTSIAETVRQSWSDRATLVYASPDLAVLVGRYDPAAAPLIVLQSEGADGTAPLDAVRGTVLAVLSPGQQDVTAWLDEHGYLALKTDGEDGWVSAYGIPDAPLAPLSVDVGWRGTRVASLESIDEVQPGDAIPVRVTTESGAGTGEALKWSVRLVDAAGNVLASNDRPFGPPDKFGVFVPPETPPGSYRVIALAYDPATLEPIAAEASQTAGQTEATLFEVVVRKP